MGGLNVTGVINALRLQPLPQQLTCFEGGGLDDAAGAVAHLGGVGRDRARGREEKLNFPSSRGRAVRSVHRIEGLVWRSKEDRLSM